METFCITALEAATTRTFVISNDLAVLQNTVGDRGAIIKGDASTKEWQSNALQRLFYYMDERHSKEKEDLIEKNYEWATKLTWKNQTQRLLTNYIEPTLTHFAKSLHFDRNQKITSENIFQANDIISNNHT